MFELPVLHCVTNIAHAHQIDGATSGQIVYADQHRYSAIHDCREAALHRPQHLK